MIVIGRGGYDCPSPGSGARYHGSALRRQPLHARASPRGGLGGRPDGARPAVRHPLVRARAPGALRAGVEGHARAPGGAAGRPAAEAAIMAAAAGRPRSRGATGRPPPDDAVYHGPLGEIVHPVAPRTEADPVACSARCSPRSAPPWATCATSTRAAPGANLFVVLVGDSSTGRKGTAGSIAREVMNRAYPDWSQLMVAGLGSGEGLVGYLKAHETQGEHRALVMESESGGCSRSWPATARRSPRWSVTLGTASRWAGSSPASRPRPRAPRRGHRPHHPGRAPREAHGTDAANGFGNRFIWLAVRRTRLVPFPMSPGRAPRPRALRGRRLDRRGPGAGRGALVAQRARRLGGPLPRALAAATVPGCWPR